MGWRETVQATAASFRGVPFELRSSELTGGRKNVRHGFPQRDLPYFEDLGRADRQFRIEAYVDGDGYLAKRDALLEALNKPGQGGTLVHPHYGVRVCFCRGYTVSEGVDRGGVAWFSIDLVEVAEPLTVYKSKISREDIYAAAAELEDAGSVELQEQLVTAAVPQVAREATATELGKLGQALQNLDAFSSQVEQTVAEYQRRITSLITDAAALATSPAVTATAILGAVGAVIDTAQNASRALYAYEVLALQLKADRHLGSSRTSSNARSNANLTVSLARTAAVAGAARAAALVQWASLEDAMRARARLLALIDAEAAVASDQTYPQLSALRAEVVAGVPPATAQLPRLERFELTESVPAVVLAFELYGDAGRAEELWVRNRASNPMFLPSGVQIEALV